jgi:hypothetical protein
MLKHSVTNRMVGTFATIFSSKTLGFRTMLIISSARKPGGSYYSLKEVEECVS